MKNTDMREIKFRGRQIDSGAWWYGSLHRRYDGTYIYPLPGSPDDLDSVDYYGVDHETVGQFTGLKDKNGNEIYEGDIIEIEYHAGLPSTAGLKHLTIRTVCEYGYDASFHLSGLGHVKDNSYMVGYSGSAVKRKEVIGNIYENPELLK